MSRPHTHAAWEAPDRAAAIAAATEAHGEGGSKMRAGMPAVLAASDVELFGSPAWMTQAPTAFRAMVAQGLEGYADDRLTSPWSMAKSRAWPPWCRSSVRKCRW